MSTQVSEIVGQAFREGNLVAAGEDPTAGELTEALPLLRNLFSSLFGFELGESYRDWYIPRNAAPSDPLRSPPTPTGDAATDGGVYPPPNVRLLASVSAPTTIYFPAVPSDGARIAFLDVGSSAVVTLSGNGRLVEGATSLSHDPGDLPGLHGRWWLYRADLANWIRMDAALTMEGTLPIPPEFDDLWVTGLFIRLAPRHGVSPDPTIVQRFGDMVGRLKRRYRQTEGIPSTAGTRAF